MPLFLAHSNQQKTGLPKIALKVRMEKFIKEKRIRKEYQRPLQS